ncbi:hypothetical protein NVP2117O_68 [Vibrio phage 2.117.O._10N.261.45.E9]|nr:hypothetical protein NVP1117O_68 [Vibrio phage 1.117.O._10N.261.45.E9]AUR95469.1 hypothetical protein NVP1207B_62 [Vibrio phage 1.207.B._10N.222.51.C2]AUS02360.1 hypothetical protein NVP2117O_68 [Vibrio phage 2.117.O._10N.261.45.E9]
MPRKRRLLRPLKCDCCSSHKVALVNNRLLYRKSVGDWPLLWYCFGCRAAVACHSGTDEPLGLMADRETRKARSNAHRAFDAVWKESSMTRREAYYWLRAQLGINIKECHIGLFDAETCDLVISLSRTKVRYNRKKKRERAQQYHRGRKVRTKA